jgi:hypothetical protein
LLSPEKVSWSFQHRFEAGTGSWIHGHGARLARLRYPRTHTAEAKKMARDAISGYIESLKKHHEPIPTDDESLVASLD